MKFGGKATYRLEKYVVVNFISDRQYKNKIIS